MNRITGRSTYLSLDLPRDLLIPWFDVTNRLVKGHLGTPKRSLGKVLEGLRTSFGFDPTAIDLHHQTPDTAQALLARLLPDPLPGRSHNETRTDVKINERVLHR